MTHYYVPFEAVPYLFLISNHYFSFSFLRMIFVLSMSNLNNPVCANRCYSHIINIITYCYLFEHTTSSLLIVTIAIAILHIAFFFPTQWISQSSEGYVLDVTRYFLCTIIIILFIYFFCGSKFDVNHFAASDSDNYVKDFDIWCCWFGCLWQEYSLLCYPKMISLTLRTTRWATWVDKHW